METYFFKFFVKVKLPEMTIIFNFKIFWYSNSLFQKSRSPMCGSWGVLSPSPWKFKLTRLYEIHIVKLSKISLALDKKSLMHYWIQYALCNSKSFLCYHSHKIQPCDIHFFLFKRLSCELLMAAIPHKDLMQVLSLDRCNGISASDLSEILTEVRYRY